MDTAIISSSLACVTLEVMKKQWLIFGLIILTAFVFRFNQLTSIPPGLYPDEAMNGNDAIQAMETGHYRVFYPNNNGREGLFINLQTISLRVFGKHIWALRIVSAIVGLLTVIGLYLLTRLLFNWQIASLTSFLMAISFWHTLFSRIGFRAIMAPFFIVWGMYFLWRGLRSLDVLDFILSGCAWGLGIYTYIGFRIMPFLAVIAVLFFWQGVKKSFSHEKYLETRMRLVRGFGLLMLTSIFVALPILYYFYSNPEDFIGRAGQVSVFASGTTGAVATVLTNTIKTLGMFNFVGDGNWRHNYGGAPMLLWPVGILFLAGFFRAWLKLIKGRRAHGHYPTIQVLLLAWFFLALLPEILSNEGIPHALRAIQVIPVVYIFAGEGLWWLYESIVRWYQARDPHTATLPHVGLRESQIVALATLLIFLASITVAEYNKYFNIWAHNPITAAYYNQNYVDLGNMLNTLPQSVKKYVVVNAGGVLVNNIPMPSQTVMFVTDTFTPAKQAAKNLYYLTEEQYATTRFNRTDLVFKLEP